MSIQGDTEALARDIVVAVDAVRETVDPAALSKIRTTTINFRARARTIRGNVDALDILATVDDGADLIRAAIWERDTRRDLVRVEQHSGELADALASLPPGGYRQRTYRVRSGDTLQTIARTEMGDWQAWTQIVAANRIDPGEPLTIGAELIIPEPE